MSINDPAELLASAARLASAGHAGGRAENPAPGRPLTEDDAVDIWIARWLRIRRVDLVRRYRCDPRRLYEIWEGKRFPASRSRALKLFSERHPELLDRVDFGQHRTIPRVLPLEGQFDLFG